MASDLTARVKRGGKRRRKAPAAYPRGGAAPEKTELGLPGVESSGIWVVRGLRDTHSPPGAFAGLGEVRGGACCDGGGFPWRRSPELGHLVVLGLEF